jgi:GWxTD domain-containing protein
MTSALIVVLMCMGATPAFASWAMPSPSFEIEGVELDEGARFARIDSLESVLGGLDGDREAEAKWRLAQLYLSTELFKHRRYALELLDDVAELQPSNPDPHYLWAEVAGSMQYHREVRVRMGEVIERHPERVESRIVLASSEYRNGVQRLSEDRLRSARRAWRAAVEVDSSSAEVWHGLALTALALGEYRATRRAARSLVRRDPAPGLMLEAAAHHRIGDSDLAWSRFQEALELIDESERWVFLRGHGFLSGADLEAIAANAVDRAEAFEVLREQGQNPLPGDDIDWEIVLRDAELRERVLAEWWTIFDERPAQEYSTGELEFWTRLVEADALFGKPSENVRGWQTPQGDVWVRWGRPTSYFYDPGGGGSSSRLDALGVAGVRFPPDSYLPPNAPPIWVWTYRWPGTWISFLFSDESRNARWSPSESSARSLADFRAQIPILLPRYLQARPFELAVSAVSYPRSGEDAVVETHIAFEPTQYLLELASPDQREELIYSRPDSLAIVDWQVSDMEGNPVDRAHRVIGPEVRRSVLLGQLGRRVAPTARDPFIVSIGARLPAGRYNVGVEVLEPITGAVSSERFTLVVSSPEPGDLLEISGLQLAAAFTPWSSEMRVPPEFVKYATAVVPAPDHRVPMGSDALGVYFEVRNLARDERGMNSFDVRYAIYRSNREIRDLAFQAEPDLEGLELVGPASLSFLEESTGASAEGLVIKGTELDVGDLDAGDYVLVVTIRDRLADYSGSRATAFRVPSN